MGDALSHSLLPGVAAAWYFFGTSTTALFFGGLAAGLLTALGSALLSRMTRVKEDAAFGSLFIVFFGAGVALVSKLPSRINLADFLFGNVLGVSSGELRLATTVSFLTVGGSRSSTGACSSRPLTPFSTGQAEAGVGWSTWASLPLRSSTSWPRCRPWGSCLPSVSSCSRPSPPTSGAIGS